MYYNPNSNKTFSISSLPVPSFLKEYLNYLLSIRNLTIRTVISYYTHLNTFLQWLTARSRGVSDPQDVQHTDISKMPFEAVEEVTTADIYEYLSYCTTVLNNGSASRATKLSALRGFFSYYTDTIPRLASDPVSSVHQPKKEKKLPKYLTEDECITLLTTVKDNPVSNFPERDMCMLVFMLNCGMRVSELVGINLVDIRDTELRLFGKGRKERVVFLNSACVKVLNDYLPERNLAVGPDRDEPALFVKKNDGTRITVRRVEQIVERMMMVSGFAGRGISPHKLRHTCATLIYNNGGDVLELKEILGHEDVSTTSIYTHLGSDTIREAMENSPLSDVGV